MRLLVCMLLAWSLSLSLFSVRIFPLMQANEFNAWVKNHPRKDSDVLAMLPKKAIIEYVEDKFGTPIELYPSSKESEGNEIAYLEHEIFEIYKEFEIYEESDEYSINDLEDGLIKKYFTPKFRFTFSNINEMNGMYSDVGNIVHSQELKVNINRRKKEIKSHRVCGGQTICPKVDDTIPYVTMELITPNKQNGSYNWDQNDIAILRPEDEKINYENKVYLRKFETALCYEFGREYNIPLDDFLKKLFPSSANLDDMTKKYADRLHQDDLIIEQLFGVLYDDEERVIGLVLYVSSNEQLDESELLLVDFDGQNFASLIKQVTDGDDWNAISLLGIATAATFGLLGVPSIIYMLLS